MVVDVFPAAVLDTPSPLVTAILGLMGGPEDGGIDAMLSDFQQGTGIDLLSVEFAEMFMDIEALLGSGMEMESEEPQFGAAFYGEFDEDEIVASFERGEGIEYEVSEYRGFTVYRLDEAGGDPMSIAIVDSGTVLVGVNSGVEGMLDVAAGAAPSLSGGLRDVLDSLGDRHIGIALALPPDYFDALGMEGEGEDAVPQMGLLGALDMSALTAPVSGLKLLFHEDAAELESISLYDDSAAATASKEYSEGIVAMFGTMLATSPELKEFALGMEVGLSGEVVTFKMVITVEIIKQLLGGLATGL